MAVCGTGISSISTVDGISGVILPPTQVIVEKLAEQIEFSHLAQSLRERIGLITDLQNGLTQVNSTVVNETGILAQELLALRNDLTNAVAYIDQQTSVSIEQRQSMVTSINTMMAQWGNRIAALEETSTVLSQDTGAMLAEKVIKADLNGNVVGYGLSARVDPNGQFSSDFQVRADTFSIAPPSVTSSTEPPNNTLYNGKIWIDSSTNPPVTKWYNKTTNAWQTTPVKGAVPFIVKTSKETIDGITVEPGVYIDSAYVSRLRADQIDTRGLSIRDAYGNVILAAGTALDWSNVGGTGKPANNATRNQIFRQTAAPTGGTYSIGDLWIDTDAVPTTVSNWDGTQWVIVGNYTNNTSQLTDGAGLGTTAIWSSVTGRPTTLAALDAAAASQLDKKSVTYYQATQPTGMVAADAGDIWFDTGNSYKMYSYSGTSWVLVQDSSAASAAASQAQTTANTKITTYYSTSTPTASTVGDLWYNSTTKLLQRWSGSAWVATANAFDNTNQLTDGAGLGTTAIWASVTGANKPQDNATVGATFGVNIGGQITPTNASTYIAAAAIGDAYISNLNASKLVANSITTDKIQVGAVSASNSGYAGGTNVYPASTDYSKSYYDSGLLSLYTSGTTVPLFITAVLSFFGESDAVIDYFDVSCQILLDGSNITAPIVEVSDLVRCVKGNYRLSTASTKMTFARRFTGIASGNHNFGYYISASPRRDVTSGSNSTAWGTNARMHVRATIKVWENKV